MLKRILLASVITAMTASSAFAVTETVTANINFETAIDMVATPAEFGTVEAASAGTYVLTTGSVLTATGVGEIVEGTPAAASITISGSTSQTINIDVNNPQDSADVALGTFTCNYDATSEVACTDASLNTAAAPDAGTVLLVGMTATVTGTPAVGVAQAPTFDVVVVYN